MTSRIFWADAVERAIKTAAQTGVALLTVEGTSLLELNWEQFWSAIALAAIVSVMTSLGSSKTGDTSSASLLK